MPTTLLTTPITPVSYTHLVYVFILIWLVVTKRECLSRSNKHSLFMVDFSVVCQPPAPLSGKYQVFPLPANLRHLCSEKISDFRCQPTADAQLS